MPGVSKGSVKEALTDMLGQAKLSPALMNEQVGTLINAYYKTVKGQLQDKESNVIAKQILLLALQEKKFQFPAEVVTNLQNTWREQAEEKIMVSLPDTHTRFSPLSALSSRDTTGFFRLRELGKQAEKQGLLNRSKHYTAGELRDRWYTDRDVLLALCAAFTTGKNMATPELWMIRNMGEPNATKDTNNLSDDSQSSSAAWTHYLGIPHENVIALPGFRSGIVKGEAAHNARVMRGDTESMDYYATWNALRDAAVRRRDPSLVAQTQRHFLSEIGYTAESEYQNQPPKVVAANADLATEVKAAVDKRLPHTAQEAVTLRQQGFGQVNSDKPFSPIILFVYGHYNSNTNSYGGNSMLDMIEQLKWLGLEEIMQRTITIVGISCHSLPVMRDMCLDPSFQNAVMACGTLRRIDPITRKPDEFYGKNFYYYSHSLSGDEDKLAPNDIENRPLLPDLFFSLKTGLNSTQAPVMSERFDIEDLAHAMPALTEDPMPFIESMNTLLAEAGFNDEIMSVVWQYMGYLSLYQAVRTLVSVDTPLIESLQRIETMLNPVAEEKAKPMTPNEKTYALKQAAQALADIARKHITWVTNVNLTMGVKPEESELRAFLDLLCRRSLVGKKAEKHQVSTQRREKYGLEEKAVSPLNVNKNESTVTLSDEAMKLVIDKTYQLYGQELMQKLAPSTAPKPRK